MAEIVQKQTKTRTLPSLRLEHLWALLVLSVVGIFISLSPTSPNDFFWHLKAGELIATTGIPTTNLFAWSLSHDTPFVYQSWLGEWLFYALYQLGGLPMVVFGRNILGLGAFTLVAIEAQRRSGSWRLAALAAFLAAAMTINNLTTRTQNWSWLPFVVTLIILGRYTTHQIDRRWLIALPLLMVFWVNAHGAFVMGLLVTFAFIAGETLQRLLRQPRALSWEQLRALYLTGGAMLLATLVNPLGLGVFGYLRHLLADPSSQRLINEWQPPTPDNLAGMFFYLSILGLFAAFAFATQRPRIAEIILVSGLAWQAFTGVRYVVWFGMAAMPILVQCLAQPQTRSTIFGIQREYSKVAWRWNLPNIINLILACFLTLGVITFQPWFKSSLPLPLQYREQFVDLPGAPQLFSDGTPVNVTEHLRELPCEGNLFNEMGYGSYLIWALYPETQVFIDPRVELYPLAFWQDYISLTRGRDVPELLAKYDIACVMLDLEAQPGLAETMIEIPGWTKTFDDEQSELWRRDA
jgi:hypothetical protein